MGVLSRLFARCLTILVLIQLFFCAPSIAGSLTERAAQLHKRGQYREAVQLFDRAIAKNPRNANAIYYAADCYMRLGEISKATILYKALIAKFPGTLPAQYARRALLVVSRSYSNGHEKASMFGSQVIGGTASAPNAVTVPFSKENTGHLIVECLINGRAQRMVFDTGASVCVATRDQLSRLGIEVPVGGPESLATGVSGTVRTQLMPVEIQLGSIKKRVVLSVMDQLPTLPLLGETFFGDYQFIVDNTEGNIEFFRPGSKSASIPSDTIDIPFVKEGKELKVNARINEIDVDLFFDTGAQRTVLPTSEIFRTGRDRWKLVGYGTASGVGGQGVCKAYKVDSFSVGPIQKFDFGVVTVDRLPIPNGLLGQDFFGHRKFTIDNRRNLIRFWR